MTWSFRIAKWMFPAAVVLAAGCAEEKTASANLESRSGSTVTGTATFTEGDEKVTVKLDVAGATPGKHGVHIHENGDCSAPDATSAGGHWNPSGVNHGAPEASPHHAGDMGNITVGADGKGTLTLSSEDWQLGTGAANDVVGKAVIIHAAEDDLTTQPTGNSGGRVACGVIAIQQD
jgi:Cu-Zn family superoxide dismutase